MKHKLGVVGFSYLLGLICAALLRSWAVFIVCGGLALGTIMAAVMKKKTFVLVLASAFAACFAGGAYTLLVYEPLVSEKGKEAVLSGRVSNVDRYSRDLAAYTVDTEINGVKASVIMLAPDYGAEPGDGIEMRGRLEVMRDNADFAEESYYRSKGIFLRIATPEITEVSHKDFDLKAAVYNFSDYIGGKIGYIIGGDEGAIIRAMFLGDKSKLSDELSLNVKRAGVSHFTAVSGLHLTLAAHIALLIISLTPIRKRRLVKYGTLTGIILMFMLFFRFSASVLRAGVMLVAYYGAELFMRKGSTVNSMGGAILVITLFSPYACLDLGLLMSLAGTFGIGILSPALCVNFKRDRFYKAKSTLMGAFCAAAVTLPLVCICFGGVSLAGIVSNMLIIPLFMPILVCMLLFTVSGGLADLFLYAAKPFASGMVYLINTLGGFDYSYFGIRYEVIILIFIAAAVFVGLSYLVFRNKWKTAGSVFISLCVLMGAGLTLTAADKDKTAVLLYSDGDEACMIIEKRQEAHAFVSGYSEDIEKHLAEYLSDSGKGKLSFILVIEGGGSLGGAYERYSLVEPIFADEYGTESYSGEALDAFCEDGACTVKSENVTIMMTCAGNAERAENGDINIIYGYRKNMPQLDGICFCSSRRIQEEGYRSIYFEKSDYLISSTGYIEKINL